MAVDILTKEYLNNFKAELFEEIKTLIRTKQFKSQRMAQILRGP